jgi:hypothetical protein
LKSERMEFFGVLFRYEIDGTGGDIVLFSMSTFFFALFLFRFFLFRYASSISPCAVHFFFPPASPSFFVGSYRVQHVNWRMLYVADILKLCLSLCMST